MTTPNVAVMMAVAGIGVAIRRPVRSWKTNGSSRRRGGVVVGGAALVLRIAAGHSRVLHRISRESCDGCRCRSSWNCHFRPSYSIDRLGRSLRRLMRVHAVVLMMRRCCYYRHSIPWDGPNAALLHLPWRLLFFKMFKWMETMMEYGDISCLLRSRRVQFLPRQALQQVFLTLFLTLFLSLSLCVRACGFVGRQKNDDDPFLSRTRNGSPVPSNATSGLFPTCCAIQCLSLRVAALSRLCDTLLSWLSVVRQGSASVPHLPRVSNRRCCLCSALFVCVCVFGGVFCFDFRRLCLDRPRQPANMQNDWETNRDRETKQEMAEAMMRAHKSVEFWMFCVPSTPVCLV